ncbi:MAG: T9SS type A sorting domain-containing protein [Saprospiraceae bacterium]|nr:T9SS type A sorting domain-containing protein [Saprospiraceae bacterium]
MKTHATKLKLVFLCAFLGLSLSPLYSVTRTVIATGNWTDASSWQGGLIPTNADDVDMNGSTTITVRTFEFIEIDDISTGNNNGITVNAFGSLETTEISGGTDMTIIVNGNLLITGDLVVGDRFNLTVNGIFTVLGNMTVMNDANITVNGGMGVGSFNGLDRVNFDVNGAFASAGDFFVGNDSSFESSFLSLFGGDVTAKDRFNLVVDGGAMGIDGDLTAGAGSTSMITTNFFNVNGMINGPAGFGALTPLPISLSYFKGQATEEGALLSWETLAEESNAYFTIEKSRDGVHFEELTRVKGAGDSDVPLQYKHLDKNPYKLTYYRLRQTDYDGTTEVFNIVTISVRDKAEDIKVFPTIVRDRLVNVELPSETPTVEGTIVDLSGRVILRTTLQEGRNSLELPGALQNGMYILRIYDPVLRTATAHQIMVQE